MLFIEILIIIIMILWKINNWRISAHLNKKYNKKNLLVNNICLEKKYLYKWNLNSIHVKNKKIEEKLILFSDQILEAF